MFVERVGGWGVCNRTVVLVLCVGPTRIYSKAKGIRNSLPH